jgi:hypothetical protein
VPGEARGHDCKTNGKVKDARLKSKSRRPLQSQNRYFSGYKHVRGGL